ncbi:MAG: rane protein of unknown function [Nitrospira sp.]|jgi:hypothetical protein|nr:rane protein of unknown function [Nitrospira sp.]
MSPEQLRLVLLGIATTVLPFATGIFKNGLVEVVLLVPIAWLVFGRRSREPAIRTVLVLMSVCVTLTVCDLLLRPLAGAHLHYSPMNLHQRRLPALPMLGRWDPMVQFTGEVYGDLAAMTGNPAFREPRTIEFRTDARGFRNDTVPNPIDLIVLGDSFAAGVGVTQSGTFAHALATSLHRPVYNLSYPGGPYDQYVNFSIEVASLGLKPGAELIWTLFTGNDLEDAAGDTWDMDALPWRKGFSSWLVEYRTFRDRSPLRQAWNAVRSRWKGIAKEVIVRRLPDGRDMLFYSPQEAWGTRPREKVERHSNFPRIVKTLLAMKETVSRMGVHMTIIILPTKGEVYHWILSTASSDREERSSGFANALLNVCDQLALRCRDSRAYLTGEARRLFENSHELLWWRDDTHLNERGHHAVAAMILQGYPELPPP